MAEDRDAAALERLDQEFCLGKTDLDACLRQAVKEFAGPSGKRRRLMVYVGDGASESAPVLNPADQRLAYPWLGREAAATLVVLATQPTKSKTDYLRSLVEAGGGVWFDLAGDVRAAGSLARWLQCGLPSPERIVSVAVDGASADDLFYSRGWLPGEPLYIYGRIAETSPFPAATAGAPVDLPSRSVKLRLTIGRGKKDLHAGVDVSLDRRRGRRVRRPVVGTATVGATAALGSAARGSSQADYRAVAGVEFAVSAHGFPGAGERAGIPAMGLGPPRPAPLLEAGRGPS